MDETNYQNLNTNQTINLPNRGGVMMSNPPRVFLAQEPYYLDEISFYRIKHNKGNFLQLFGQSILFMNLGWLLTQVLPDVYTTGQNPVTFNLGLGMIVIFVVSSILSTVGWYMSEQSKVLKKIDQHFQTSKKEQLYKQHNDHN